MSDIKLNYSTLMKKHLKVEKGGEVAGIFLLSTWGNIQSIDLYNLYYTNKRNMPKKKNNFFVYDVT